MVSDLRLLSAFEVAQVRDMHRFRHLPVVGKTLRKEYCCAVTCFLMNVESRELRIPN